MKTRYMHTLILNMCVLLPFGANTPASLLAFSDDEPYDAKSEYKDEMST